MPRDRERRGGQRSGASRINWDRLAPPWTVEELTVVWAVTPRLNQNYNQNSPFVKEVADLLCRSPSAVDRKMANLWAVWRPGSGMSHVSRNDRIVVGRYRGRDVDLIADANHIRERLADRMPTARAEGKSPRPGPPREQVQAAVRSEAENAGMPLESVIIFKRKGSEILGFAVDPFQVLTGIGLVVTFAGAALRLFPWMRATVALRLAQRRDLDRFARAVLNAKLPSFHLRHLSRHGLLHLATEVSRYHLDPIRFTKALVRSFRGMDLHSTKAGIAEVLHVESRRLCGSCTILLAAVVEKVRLAAARRVTGTA